MKKYLVVLFSLFCFLPIVMNAEVKSMNLVEALKDEGIESDIDYEENDNQTTIYFFRTKGESKSVDFLKYLDSIYARYGKFFKVRSYEVSGNDDNMLLMKNTFDYLRTDVNTTPFIVIGSTYFITYKEDINENIEKAFIEYYQSESLPCASPHDAPNQAPNLCTSRSGRHLYGCYIHRYHVRSVRYGGHR